MGYQGIIFDFNGVLWWDNHLQERAWREFAEQKFGVSLADDDMAVEIHGRNNQHTLEFLAGITLDTRQVDQLSNQKEELYRELCLAEGADFRLSPGAVDLLDALRAGGIPRTIATASGWDNLLFFIEHLRIERWFERERILYNDGIRPGKPAPDIYQLAAQKIGMKPADCVVVEDSIAGIQAARAACIGYIIALIQDRKNLPGSTVDGIDLTIENLTQVPMESLFNTPVEQNRRKDRKRR